MKLSVIICVYNTATEYLAECIKSITNSTLKEIEGDYEICFVDDGSTVDYSGLRSEFNLKYIKTENRGILSARKTGAEMAEGEYSIFCDSDDTVSFNYHLPMLDAAKKRGADIVINDWAFHTARARYTSKSDETLSSDLDLSGDEILRTFFKHGGAQHSFYVLWNKLYKTELLKQAFSELLSSGYPQSSCYGEDAAINFFAWNMAKRVVNIHTGYYFYRIHQTQTVNATSKEKLKKQIEYMSACFAAMRGGISCTPNESELSERINEWEALMARAHYSVARGAGYTDIFPFISEKYEIGELKKSSVRDAMGYSAVNLLGANFLEIDTALLSVWSSPTAKSVKYKKRDTYTARCVDFLIQSGKAKIAKPADVVIPKMRNTLKTKLLHNALLYKIGLVFFRKGSRIRNFLKKFI